MTVTLRCATGTPVVMEGPHHGCSLPDGDVKSETHTHKKKKNSDDEAQEQKSSSSQTNTGDKRGGFFFVVVLPARRPLALRLVTARHFLGEKIYPAAFEARRNVKADHVAPPGGHRAHMQEPLCHSAVKITCNVSFQWPFSVCLLNMSWKSLHIVSPGCLQENPLIPSNEKPHFLHPH